MTKENKKRPRHDYLEKSPESEEFTYNVKRCGGSAHIPLGKRWINRFIKVKVEEVKEE